MAIEFNARPSTIVEDSSHGVPVIFVHHGYWWYRSSVLPPEITARVAVEEESTFGWDRYTGAHGSIIGLHCVV